MREEFLKRLQETFVEKGSFQKYEILSNKVEMLKYEELLLLLSKEEVEGFIQYLWSSVPSAFASSKHMKKEIEKVIDEEIKRNREQGIDMGIESAVEKLRETAERERRERIEIVRRNSVSISDAEMAARHDREREINRQSHMRLREEEKDLVRRLYIRYCEMEALESNIKNAQVRLFKEANQYYRSLFSKYRRLIEYTKQYSENILNGILEGIEFNRVKNSYIGIKKSIIESTRGLECRISPNFYRTTFMGDIDLHCEFKVSKEQSDTLVNSFLFKLLGLETDSVKYEEGNLSVIFKFFNELYLMDFLAVSEEEKKIQELIENLIFGVLARTSAFYFSNIFLDRWAREYLSISEIELNPIKGTIGYSINGEKQYLNHLEFCSKIQMGNFTVES